MFDLQEPIDKRLVGHWQPQDGVGQVRPGRDNEGARAAGQVPAVSQGVAGFILQGSLFTS